MFIFVGVLLVICAIGSLADLTVTFFRHVPTENRDQGYLERKRVRTARDMWTFWICVSGFVFLISGFVTPLGVLLTVAMMEALGYALALVNFNELFGK